MKRLPRERKSRSRSKERDKIHTPDGKDIRTKSGAVKKSKSSAGKAGAGSKGKSPGEADGSSIRLFIFPLFNRFVSTEFRRCTARSSIVMIVLESV